MKLPLSYYINIIQVINQTLINFFLKKSQIVYVQKIAKGHRTALRLPRFKRTLREVFANHPPSVLFSGLMYGRLLFAPTSLRRPNRSTFPRELFHIKCLFDVEEFALYDLFNFYKTTSTFQKPHSSHNIINEPLRLNFFYKIRSSIKLFRLHTLKFMETCFNTERRVNLFFKVFSSIPTISYMWFFEFNLAVFLVKIYFSESIKHAHALITKQICTINLTYINTRWAIIKPGDIIQLPLSRLLSLWLRNSLLNKLNGAKRYAKLMTKLFFKKKVGGIRAYKKKKAISLVWSKHKTFKFIEIDPKTFSAALLPYANNSIYLKLVLTLWLNYWNYRVTLWKYNT